MGFLDELLGPAEPSTGATTPATEPSLKEVYFFFKILHSVLQKQLPDGVKSSEEVTEILRGISGWEQYFQKELSKQGFVNVDKAYKEQVPVAKNFTGLYSRLTKDDAINKYGRPGENYTEALQKAYQLYVANGELRGDTMKEFLEGDEVFRDIEYWMTTLGDWDLFQRSYFPSGRRTDAKDDELRTILEEIWNLVASGSGTTKRAQLQWLRERALNQETE